MCSVKRQCVPRTGRLTSLVKSLYLLPVSGLLDSWKIRVSPPLSSPHAPWDEVQGCPTADSLASCEQTTLALPTPNNRAECHQQEPSGTKPSYSRPSGLMRTESPALTDGLGPNTAEIVQKLSTASTARHPALRRPMGPCC